MTTVLTSPEIKLNRAKQLKEIQYSKFKNQTYNFRQQVANANIVANKGTNLSKNVQRLQISAKHAVKEIILPICACRKANHNEGIFTVHNKIKLRSNNTMEIVIQETGYSISLWQQTITVKQISKIDIA